MLTSRMKNLRCIVLFLAFAAGVFAQKPGEGSVSGALSDRAHRPIEYASAAVKSLADGKVVRSGATDAKGAFELGNIPFGTYELNYSLLGAEKSERVSFTLDAQHSAVKFPALQLAADNTEKWNRSEEHT